MKHRPLLKTLMTFVVLTACLGLAPKAFAQQSVPYTQGFENVETMHLPSGWTQDGVVYTTDAYDGHSGSKTLFLYCGNVTSTAILPTFSANISTLTIDFWMRPVTEEGYSHTSTDYVSVGYFTTNNGSNYTEVNRYYWSENEIWQQRRAAFVNAPSNARIAIRAFCDSHTYWLIDDVHVYTTPSPVMDVPYQPMMMASIPNGWVTNNYNYQPGIWTSVWPYFSTGYTAFPQLSVPLNQLRLIMGIKPHSNASSLQIGYMTNPYSLSTFTAIQEWASWYTDGSYEDWQTINVTYCFRNIPTNARIAIKCVGEWEFAENGPRVEPMAIFESYTPTSNWVTSSSLSFADDVIQGSGIVAFPSFDRSIATAALDMSLKPVTAGSTIQIGYMNNPNSPSSFVSIGTIAEYNSSWTSFQTVTEDNLSVFNSYPNARLALQFNGSWMIDEVYLHEHFVLLPTTSQALNTLYLDIELKPLGDDREVQIGYVTNANDQTTFTALQTFNSSYSWTGYHSYTICYVGVPANAVRMALVYNGGGWEYQNVNVYSDPDPIGVPYNPTFGPDSPEGWIASNYDYSSSSNNAYLTSGCAILPRFTVPPGPLQMDIDLKPGSSNYSIQIGYLTNPSDPSTFTALQTFVSSDFGYSSYSYKTMRVSFYGAPANARIALVSNGTWDIRNLSVDYMPTPIGAPYTPELPTTGQPDGWIANNYGYSTYDDYAYLSSGCAVLPRFNSITAPLSTLQMDIDLKPASSNKTIQIGYLTNPNDLSTFTVLQTFVSSDFGYSSYSYKTKRISFQGAPGDARIALVCDGTWDIRNINVYASTPIGVPYTPELPITGLPEGWIANNYGYSTYDDDAYLSSGCAVLPRFNVPLGTLQMDIDLKPASSDRTIQIGYLTNPNDQSSFTVLQTYSGFSSWSEFRTKRISFQGAPGDARIALVCDGTWYIQNVSVYAPSPIGVPYTPELPTTGQPEGWIANNYGYNTTNSYVYLNSGRAVLPRFNVPLGTLLMDIDLNPQYSNKTIQIGYITNPNDPSTFTVLQTFNSNSSWCGKYRTKRISFQGAPDDARIAIVGEGTWEIRNVEVCVSTYDTPYVEGFEDTEAGSMPLPWMSGTSNVAVTNSNPHSGSKSLYVPSGDASIVLPKLTFHSGSPSLEFRLCPNGTHASGDYVAIGYVTNPNDMSTFVEFARYNWTESGNGNYLKCQSSGTSAYYMAIKTHSSSGSWYIDDVYAHDPFTVPYAEDFSVHQGWESHTGLLYDQGGFYTCQWTPSSQGWQYGTANGVFDDSDHAYVTIGGNANQNYWLVSPIIRVNSSHPMLSFNLAMSRSTGNMVPLYPDAQDHQTVYALVTTDGGYTWHSLQGWRHEMGYADLEGLKPQGHVYHFNLSPYQGEDIQIAFYAECTNANDNLNRVHVDDISIVSFDPSQPPTSVTVSEVAGHSAKVNWAAASPAQTQWDVIVVHAAFNPNTDNMEYFEYYNGVMEHVNGYLDKIITGLLPNYDSYKAWVRYNDGSITSEWVASASFETDVVCPTPRDITIVEHGYYGAFITWTPGDENQTGWYYHIDGFDDMGVDITEPYINIPDDEVLGLEPGQTYTMELQGNCGEDGYSETVYFDFYKQGYPTLTVNDGTSTNYSIVINAYETNSNSASTQFVIPAEMLTDMQYSTIHKLQFYCSNVANGTPWGNAQFRVYLKEVDFSSYNEFCNDYFYPWSDMSEFYEGTLSLADGVMTIIPSSYSGGSFDYQYGNLLIGIEQFEVGSYSQASWYGTVTDRSMSGYIVSQYDPDIVNCSTFVPKVTFTYEPDNYLPPTDIAAEPIGNYEVYVSWTMREGSTAVDFEISDDNFTNDVWGYEDIEDGYFIYDEVWPEDNFQVRLRSVFVVNGVTIRSAWSQPVSFTMPEACESPDNLAADNIGPFSATLVWEGDAEVYEVEYRDVLSESFENGVPEGWTSLKGTETSNGWYRTGMGHSGDYGLVSICYTTNHGDDWLISPQVELGGVLSFWKTCAGPDTQFSIYVSTTGTDIDDFEYVASGTATASSSWSKFIKNLSNYSGLGYIAIRHNDNLSTPRTLYIDDLLYGYPSWTTLDATTENSIEVSGLTPGKSYQFQVRGTCDTGFTSDWSSTFVFTTVNNIVFQDPITKSACLSWDSNFGNNDGELSYAEAAAITDLGTVFQDQGQMHYFNELQYFTGLTEIGEDAFSGCSNLEAITLPPQITNIDYYAFGYCSSLQNITIPNGVTTIGDFAFIESGLTEVNLPPSVTYIGGLAFGDCNSLTSINIPASVTNINGNAFTGASIESIVVAVDNPTYDSRGGCNAIIKTATNKLITGCQNTVIPDDVTTIGISAFEKATGLTEITLPASVTNIGEYAFMNCYGLTTINAEAETPPDIYGNTFLHLNPEDITVNVPCGFLQAYAFANYWEYFNFVDPCNIVFADANVKAICVTNWDTNGDGELSYTEAEAVTSLGTVFRGNTTITSFNELVYFTGLQALAANAFNGCTQLTSVMLPNGIIATGNNSFKDCSSLVSVTLPESLRRIVNYTFQNCSALTHIDFPSTVTYIGMAFGGCSSLSSIVIPASVNTIIDGAFNNCHSLQSIVVESGNTVYDSRNGCNAIIKTETNELVVGCDNTVIPDDVVAIGQNAFYGRTQMTTITLPASVTSIGAQAFYNCTGLQSIDVRSATPATLGSNAFQNVPTNIPVYVPCESIETYQAATGWSNFTNFQGNPEFICFADPNVKAVCVAHWDTNGDGELSYSEAAAVDLLSQHFQGNTSITTFDELQYFTGMVDISPSAFMGCTALVSVTLPESIQSIYASAFEGCTALQSIVIPDATTLVFIRAFYGCTSLSSIEFGTGLTTIRELAFRGCTGLTSLTLPASLATIGNAAFEYCTNLEEMTVLATTPPTLDEYAFDYVPTDIPVYVPCESLSAYRAAYGWSDFTNIIDPCAGVVQVIELAEGWNWVSIYLEIEDPEEMMLMLQEALGENGLQIVEKYDYTTYADGEWGDEGELEEVTNEEMYMIETSAACTVELQGLPADPADHVITIEPGWNWIGFPSSEVISIEDAFADFEAEDDDMLVGKFGYTTYVDEWGDEGDLEELTPSQGYMYYSNSEVTKTLVFSTGSKSRAKNPSPKAKLQLVKPDVRTKHNH